MRWFIILLILLPASCSHDLKILRVQETLQKQVELNAEVIKRLKTLEESR